MHLFRELVFACAFLALAASAHAERRVALVIGNSAYAHTPALANPANDAADVAAALKRLGFEVIDGIDLGKAAMDDAFRRFARALGQADAALFFYAGHGMQFNGVNYLMPVDARLEDEADLPYEMASLDNVLAELSRVDGVRIAVLDSCRNNPLEEQLKRSLARTRGVPATRGLARIEKSQGLLLAYATQPGDVADDGDGRNSPFTAALLANLEAPGVEVGTLFRRVAREVNATTAGGQLPEVSISLLGEFYFNPGAGGAAPGPGAPGTQPPADSIAADYALASQIGTTAAWDAFLKKHGERPDDFYVGLARAAREKLALGIFSKEPAAQSPSTPPACDGGVVTNVAGEDRCLKPGDTFRDCDECPEMVVIPAGSFMMGPPESEEGRTDYPQHKVTIAAPFAVGKFELTRGEFATFVADGGHNAGSKCWTKEEGAVMKERSGRSWRNPGFSQDDAHPVTCVNWDDGKAYAAWMSRATGVDYRLLTEAEWEYAARAGTTTRFHFGNRDSELCEYANGADNSTSFDWRNQECSDGVGGTTAAVGRYQPNSFGLYDMHGNVWEWVEDCYHESYGGAPSDGSPRVTGSCDDRVLRGGSWLNFPRLLRSALRWRNTSDDRSNIVGFRVARTID